MGAQTMPLVRVCAKKLGAENAGHQDAGAQRRIRRTTVFSPGNSEFRFRNLPQMQ
jgi:hypothetical protein